jgi:urease accessory protein
MKPVEGGMLRTWEAQLDLGYAFQEGRTVLARRSSRGPLAVQKTLHPEAGGVCHTILLHPPGGIAGGDDLSVRVVLDPRAHAVFATPGATRWYRSAGAAARQRIAIHVAEKGTCEWFPQENIFFAAAQADNGLDVELGAESIFCGWDVFCLGRTASGERFDRGCMRQRIGIRTRSGPLFGELAVIEGGSAVLDSAAGMAGYPVCGTFVLAGTQVDGALLERCRGVAGGADCRHGVTVLPKALVARYLGRSAEQARDYFSRIWEVLRPAYANREARRLRIWAT